MNKKILIGSIFAALILLMIPIASSQQANITLNKNAIPVDDTPLNQKNSGSIYCFLLVVFTTFFAVMAGYSGLGELIDNDGDFSGLGLLLAQIAGGLFALYVSHCTGSETCPLCAN